MAGIGDFIHDIVMALATRRDRPAIDGPDPAYPPCRCNRCGSSPSGRAGWTGKARPSPPGRHLATGPQSSPAVKKRGSVTCLRSVPSAAMVQRAAFPTV
jgi:hypothetical protein